MEKSQLNLDKFKYKTIAIHGLCRCGFYISGETVQPILKLDNGGGVEILHTHFTMRCFRCGALINLVDICKKPLRKREA